MLNKKNKLRTLTSKADGQYRKQIGHSLLGQIQKTRFNPLASAYCMCECLLLSGAYESNKIQNKDYIYR